MSFLLKVIGWLGGSILVGLLVLALVGVVAWFVIKGKLSGFFVKASIAAQPPKVHLVRERAPMWDDHEEVEKTVDSLRALGFRALGTFGIQEVEGFQLVALAHPREGYAAAVFEHTENGIWVDYAARFSDSGAYLVASASPSAVKPPKMDGFQKILSKKADPKKLYKTFIGKVAHGLVDPVTPDNYVEFFETYYEEEMRGLYAALGIEADGAAPQAVEMPRDEEADRQAAPLFQALDAADGAALRQAVADLQASGGSLEGRDADGRTPLMAAVMTGDLDLVRPLLDAGADVNASVPGSTERPFHRSGSIEDSADPDDPDAQAAAAAVGRVLGALGAQSFDASETLTPLILAVWVGNDAMAQALVDAGAAVEGGDPRPLNYAVDRGDLHMVNLILRAGADVNGADASGTTALMTAVQEEDVETVQWLLEAGAAVDLKDEDGDTALSHAGIEGCEDIFEILVPLAKKNIRKARKYLADSADPERNVGAARLISAASGGKIARLQRILGQGQRPDEVDEAGSWTALMAAASGGHLRAMRLLLDAGADVNARNEEGDTALSYAAESFDMDPRRRPDAAQMLLDAGASLDLLSPEARRKVVGILQSRGGLLPA